MKKLIGVLGVVAIAMTMFFNTNIKKGSDKNLDLSNLIAMNVAQAEYPWEQPVWSVWWHDESMNQWTCYPNANSTCPMP